MTSTNNTSDKKAFRLTLFNRRSLVGRFFIGSLCFLPLFIILSGTLLLNSFTHSQINAEKQQLQTHIYLLLGLTEIEKGTLTIPENLPEPRFNQQNSGLYATILNHKHQLLWRSESAILLPEKIFLSQQRFSLDQLDFFSINLIERHLNALSYDIEWIDDNDNSYPLRFIVMKDSATIDAEINSYSKRLWQWLGLMSIALLLLQALIMYWGLKPLKRLSNQLQKLQQNSISTLENNYPHEIQPAIDNLNTILKQEKQQRERYRNSLSDLAHSLKTPLAVINSQLSEKQQQDNIIDQQLHRINQIITHQLQRAVIRSKKDSINQRGAVSVHACVNRLVQVMRKVYTEKNIIFNNLTLEDHIFIGDEADLLEVLGNIVDNACKYGRGQITIDSEKTENELVIRISDNGDGIADSIKHSLLERGARADTAQIGQGIGLSVAVDIISSYGGSITISNGGQKPHLNGALFIITLPQ